LLVAVAAAVLAVTAPAPPARGQPSAPSEYELKAAFLYNFAKFVDWPDTALGGDVFCIGIVGSDPFGTHIDAMLRDKTVHDRRLVIRRFATPDDAASCQLLFFAGDGPDARAAGSGVLTVVEAPDVKAAGAVIGFAMDGNKLRFVVDAGAAERHGLKVSSQLLKLAVRVVKDGE
jgi:hypothetical protein